MTRRRRKIARTVALHLLSILFVSFLLLPIYQMLITAFETTWSSPSHLYPHPITFRNFVTMWEIVPRLPRYLLNSFIYGIGVSLLSLAIAIPSSYGLSRFRIKAGPTLMFLLFYTNMFAPIMFIVPLYEMMGALHLLNTYLAVIISGTLFTVPFCTLLLSSYIESVPKDIEDAALVDGASRLQVLFRVVLPLLAPAIVSIVIYAFITGWSQQFILALTLIQDDNLMPITQGLYQFFSRSSVSWSELMAAALVSTIIPVVMFLSVQKYIVKGLTAGSIK